MWLIVFLLITYCLVLLPLLPGLIELKRATDTEPLRVIQAYDANIKHFALGLRAYLEKNFEGFFNSNQTSSKFLEGTLRDGTVFQSAGSDGVVQFSQKEIQKKTTARLIISAYPLVLPGNMFFEKEVYGKATIDVGAGSQLRALMAEGDIELGEGCALLRWVHSNNSLYVGANCSLFGRASADADIMIGGNCRFERLNAGKIVFGAEAETIPTTQIRATQPVLKELPHVKEQHGRRWLIRGDVEIPANRFFDGDIVATGSVHIHAGARIAGSIKSNKDMYLAAGVRVEGTIVSPETIHIEPGCEILGPVITEVSVVIETGCIIGAEATPTTVSAPDIHVIGNVVVYGTVWAEEEGRASSAATPKVAL